MKTKAIHRLMLLAAISLGCIACSDETAPQPVPDGDGQLRIAYKIAGVSMSRATEDGWGDEDKDGDDEWNENTITRVDLFVFNSDNRLFRHLDSDDDWTSTSEVDGYTIAETQGLTYTEATQDKTYYMIANCPQLENATINTLSDLQAIMITPDLVFNAKQTEGFVMDDKGELDTSTELTSTLTFNLERAAVKIRLSVFSANGTTSIIDDCQYRLYNYVEKGTSVLAEAETYGEQGRESMSSLENASLIYDDSKVVFYSYPNDWFDESLLDADGTFKEDDIYAQDDLIDEARQTYIVVEYKKNTYKVPVNFSIANDNDRTFANDEEEIAYIKEIRDKYYRIKRNHIYDIKATIDVEANEIEVNHKILVNAWNEKENMDVIFGDESNESNESN